MNWKWNTGDGLPEWDDKFDELSNSYEDGGSIYGYSDDEEVKFHIDCYIEETEKWREV